MNIEHGYRPEIEHKAAKPESVEVEQLQEQASSLKDKILYHGKVGEKAVDWLEDAKDEEVMLAFGSTVRRVLAETKALEELRDTVGYRALIFGPKNKRYPVSVEFDQANAIDEIGDHREDVVTKGMYVRELNGNKWILLREPVPSQRDLWEALAWYQLPEVIHTLDHELTHWAFDTVKEIKHAAERFEDSCTEAAYGQTLLESQASVKAAEQINSARRKEFEKIRQTHLYDELVAQKSDDLYLPKREGTVDLLGTMQNLYGFDREKDTDYAVLASQAIDQLRALGMSDTDIAAAFVGAEYDSKTISIPQVDRVISELMYEQGVDQTELDFRVDTMHLKHKIEMYKAALIAREELQKASESAEAK